MENYQYKQIHLHDSTYRIIPKGTNYWFLVYSEKELKQVQKKVNRIFKNQDEALQTLKNYYLQLFKSKKEIVTNGITFKKGTYFYCKDSHEGSGTYQILGIIENEIKFRCPHFGIMEEIFEPKSFGKFLNTEQKNKIAELNKKINS